MKPFIQIHEAYKQGRDHTNHNEDAVYSAKINDRYYLLAAMDGCSGGDESVFASHLYKKILKSLVPKIAPIDNGVSDSAKWIFDELHICFYSCLKSIKYQLDLNICELESTLLTCIVDVQTQQYEMGFFGDGFFVVDDNVIENDQDNIPLYPGVFVDEGFKVYKSKMVRHNGYFIRNIGVASDGVSSFRESEFNEKVNVYFDLLIDEWFWRNDDALNRKVKLLTTGKGKTEYKGQPLYHTDDVSISRLTLIPYEIKETLIELPIVNAENSQ